MKQKIIPHLWFDREAVEAAEFYTSVFRDSQIISKSVIRDTPSGDCDTVSFSILGYSFMAISAGPLFQFNPSTSFTIRFDPAHDPDDKFEINEVWSRLSQGGAVLMPLNEYPFSKRYSWVVDRFGVSWQLMTADPDGDDRPVVTPSLLFTGDVCGRAKEAGDYYLSVFTNSRRGNFAPYPAGMEPNREGTALYSDFSLEGQWFSVMDSAQEQIFPFNEAVSFVLNCRDQEEIDYFWDKLSAVPEAEQCGWVKDKFGISWQIIPKNMGELMSKNPERTTPVMLKMKKIIIEDLKKAGEG